MVDFLDATVPGVESGTACIMVAMAMTSLISAEDQTVPVIVQTRSRVSPEENFRIIVPIDLSQVFKAWGPFPGVVAVRNQTGDWDGMGQSRNPELSDGSTALERLTEFTAPHSFAYEIVDFTGSMRFLVSGIRGEWTFTPDGSGTLIRWCYEFKPLRGRSWLLRGMIVPLWRRYMRKGLDESRRIAENPGTAHPG